CTLAPPGGRPLVLRPCPHPGPPRSLPTRRSSDLALEREQAARPLLDEQDDQHQDRDLAEHRARHRLEELVGDAEREGADQRAPRSEEHRLNSSHVKTSYAVFCLKKNNRPDSSRAP